MPAGSTIVSSSEFWFASRIAILRVMVPGGATFQSEKLFTLYVVSSARPSSGSRQGRCLLDVVLVAPARDHPSRCRALVRSFFHEEIKDLSGFIGESPCRLTWPRVGRVAGPFAGGVVRATSDDGPLLVNQQ